MTSLSLDLWDHPTSLRVSNETVWQKTAMNLAELHSTTIDGIDQSGADTDMSLDATWTSRLLNFRSLNQGSSGRRCPRCPRCPRSPGSLNGQNLNGLGRYVTNSRRTCPPNSDIDKEKYTRPYQNGSGCMNSREIKHIFDWFYNFYENSAENIDEFLDVMGLTHEAWI